MTLSREELELLKVHLPYELDLLDYAFAVAASKDSGPERSLHRLMAIDVFYLHARNLIEFYHRPPSLADGRTGAAYKFTNFEIDYPSFADYVGTINDQVAHLNLDRGIAARVRLDGKILTDVKAKLNSCLRLFQKHLSPDASHVWAVRSITNYVIMDDSRATACTEIYTSLTSSISVPDSIDNVYRTANPDIGTFDLRTRIDGK